MKWPRPLKWIYGIYAFVVFVALMLMIFPFVIIASFFGKIRGGNMIYRICMFWADLWFFLIFIYVKRIYEYPHDKTKQYVFVVNHISYFDSPVIVKAFRQPLRPLGKVEMAKIPVFGFIYKKAVVTVDRSSIENRAESMRILKSVIRKGISVLVFPEGTFNKTGRPLKEFYDGAFRLAIATQTPIKPVLFLDSYERMHYVSPIDATPGRCRIVYLNEIAVDGLGPDDMGELKEKVYKVMEEALVRYRARWIKNENKE